MRKYTHVHPCWGGGSTLQALEAHLCPQPSHHLLYVWRGGGDTRIYCSLCAPVTPSRLHNLHLNSPSMRNNNTGSLHQIFVGARCGFVNALRRIRNHFPLIRLPACAVCMCFSKHSWSVIPLRACNFIIWVQTEMIVDILWKCFHVTFLSSQTPALITRHVYQHVHFYRMRQDNSFC